MTTLVNDMARPATPRLSRNIVANLVGTFWTALMGPALISVYVRFMGIEAYGLVGILTTLQAAFTLLDLGLSTATNRELARYSVQEQDGEAARNLVRTTETMYSVPCSGHRRYRHHTRTASFHRWLHAEHLSRATIQQAFLIMGVILAFQFPFALYSGGLIGLQRQVLECDHRQYRNAAWCRFRAAPLARFADDPDFLRVATDRHRYPDSGDRLFSLAEPAGYHRETTLPPRDDPPNPAVRRRDDGNLILWPVTHAGG